MIFRRIISCVLVMSLLGQTAFSAVLSIDGIVSPVVGEQASLDIVIGGDLSVDMLSGVTIQGQSDLDETSISSGFFEASSISSGFLEASSISSGFLEASSGANILNLITGSISVGDTGLSTVIPSLAAPTLDLTTIPQPQIIITEVFVDGTDEWFELTNIGSTLFTGTLMLSGTKASLQTLTNVYLPVGASRVYGDVMAKISNQSVIARSGLSLNMTDTAMINLILHQSGHIIDQFVVAAPLVNSYDNTATSFEKVTSGSILVIKATTNLRTINILSQRIANPGEFDILSSPGSGGSTGSVSTGSTGGQISGFSLGLLKITEVFFEGRHEWIEITNFNNTDFTGTLTLIGANNGMIVLSGFTFPANTSIIIADNDTHILDKSVVLVSGLTMILNDQGAIDISLLYQGGVIDRFDVDVSLVAPYVNGINSFERVWYQGQLKITPSTGTRVFNIQSGVIANPGKVFTVVDPIVILDDDDGLDDGGGSGGVVTGIVSTGLCITNSSLLRIVEIHHQTNQLSDYIEFIPAITISGVTLSRASGQEFIISQTLRSGHRYIIAPSLSGFPLPEGVIVLPSFDLPASGGMAMLRVGGQIADSVMYGGAGSNQSLVITSTNGCQRFFTSSHIASPGFDERLLSYTQTQIQTNTITNTVYVGGGGGGGSSCPAPTPINTGQICQGFVSSTGQNQTGMIHQTGTILTGLTNSGIFSSSGQIPRIMFIDYDPIGTDTNRESITLGFDGLTPHALRPYTLHRGTTRKTMTALVMTSSVQTFTGSRSFPNTPTCVTLQSGTIVLNQYCYPIVKPEQVKSGVALTGVYVPLKIDSILYDPPGTDKNKETITLSVVGVTQYPVNLSRYTLHRGKTTKTFPTDLQLSPQTITSNRGFPNRSTCVQLRFDKTIIVDTHCYTVVKPVKPVKVSSGVISTGTIKPIIVSGVLPEISIVSVLADPEGSDKGNESITLLLHSPMSFDLSQARLGWGKTSKKISGILNQGQRMTMTGSFGFPNRDECINLLVNKQIIDTYCYTKAEEKLKEVKKKTEKKQKGTGDVYWLLETGTKAGIVAVMPNPKGKDKGNESISFLLTEGEQLDLSHTYLLIGTKKVSILSGVLSPGQEFRQLGSFGFPNKTTCFEWKMIGSDQLIDTFCYSQPKDNVIVRRSLSGLEELTKEQVLALGQIGLLKRDKDICATYDGDIIRCRRLPTRAVRLSRTDELILYQRYVSRIHNLMKSDRYPVYAYTSFIQFNKIFDQLKKDIGKFRTRISLSDGEVVPVYDLVSVYEDVYGKSYYDHVTSTMADVLLGKDSLPRKRLSMLLLGEDTRGI